MRSDNSIRIKFNESLSYALRRHRRLFEYNNFCYFGKNRKVIGLRKNRITYSLQATVNVFRWLSHLIKSNGMQPHYRPTDQRLSAFYQIWKPKKKKIKFTQFAGSSLSQNTKLRMEMRIWNIIIMIKKCMHSNSRKTTKLTKTTIQSAPPDKS